MGRASRILLPFRGEGSGTGEMTWGQREIWLTMGRTGHTMNIGGTMALPAGTPVDEMATILRYIVGRHQALRTRWESVADGLPRQVVSESGEIPLEIVDLEADDDADEVAEELRSRYEFTPFDYPNEWPVRMGVVRRGEALTHLVVQYCHLAVDGLGIDAVVRDLANLDRETGQATAPVVGLTPLELAAKQASPAGRRQSERSLRYWEGLLREIPARRLGESADPREPRFWELVFRSRAMHLAMRRIAERTRADTSHVLLAAYAVALARVTGRSPSVTEVVVSNRFRPRCADSVSHLSQPGLCVIDVAETTFDEVVARAWKAATNAYVHGYFDPLAFWAMVERVRAERGEEIEFNCFVNDRRSPQPPSPAPSEDEVRAALPETVIRWDRQWESFSGVLFIQVDTEPAVTQLSIWADTHRLSPTDIERFARELEAVTVEAALDPAAATGVAADAVRR
jgi:hypothetical protein